MNASKRGQVWLAGTGVSFWLTMCGIAALFTWGCSQGGPGRPGSNLTARSNQTNGTSKPGISKPKPPKEVAPPDDTEPPKEATTTRPGPVRFKDRRGAGPKEAEPVPADATRVLHEPVVAMTDAQAAKCVVKVGDMFPEIKLPEVGGSEEEISQLKGEKLTVVVFWNTKKVYAAEQFALLQREVAAAYGKFGVSVVAINVGDEPDTVAKLARQYEIDFPCLLDADGAAFKLVGRDKLPRTYLLDPEGKILWFDIEYSQSMRYEFNNAVYYFLKK